MFKKIASALSLSLLLSGCVTGLVANVTTFHQVDPSATQGKRLAITSRDHATDSLEFNNFRARLGNKFAQKGFTIVDKPTEAEFVAYLTYGIDSGRREVNYVSVPQYGQTGGGTTSYYSGDVYRGLGNQGYYSGSVYTPPAYGITGYSNVPVQKTIYTRTMAIEMADVREAATKKVWQGMAHSEGSCGSLTAVFDSIAEALLQNWPGQNGLSQTVTVPSAGC